MKVTVNINLIDNEHNMEWYEEQKFTKNDIESLYRVSFNVLLKEITENTGVKYDFDVKVCEDDE